MNPKEPNRCRICKVVLRAQRTQFNKLCHKHESSSILLLCSAGIIPYREWKQLHVRVVSGKLQVNPILYETIFNELLISNISMSYYYKSSNNTLYECKLNDELIKNILLILNEMKEKI